MPQKRVLSGILALLNQGGDLGWAAADIYDPAFRDALMKLNKGPDECAGTLLLWLAI